ncbi:NAD-dependent epimerase [Telmatospirillum sp. J64-1]|uniref:NAD-dependent epimerase n=1 Tax=Telmatospirillum sp. J64-1 TaxID=2502183 RepID=UPI00115D733C|nr:NAD-dependent epimerase [Telmatospirillum sp. J64-1]
MSIIVTGAAGFIGFHTAKRLLERGERVIGVDNVNDYYDPSLKEARLAVLREYEGFSFYRIDIADRAAMDEMLARYDDISDIVHLAAQAGVRYSLINPYAYSHANLEGHLVMLEVARRLKPRHFVYASSSSVYGANKTLPFSVEDRVDNPISLYAATKKANELMSHTYSHLYRIPSTGLRFFTVYGPWGRPDMAAFLFTRAIMAGQPIKVFNHGRMRRDFTYIDDIVSGVIGVLVKPPADDGETPPYRLYNIGNNRSEDLMRFIGLIERELGRKAQYEMLPMQPGDVPETYADIEALARDVGYAPTTSIDEGIPRFVSWYRDYHGV